jgi:hypothetical protein
MFTVVLVSLSPVILSRYIRYIKYGVGGWEGDYARHEDTSSCMFMQFPRKEASVQM